jgi:hypothetical protein
MAYFKRFYMRQWTYKKWLSCRTKTIPKAPPPPPPLPTGATLLREMNSSIKAGGGNAADKVKKTPLAKLKNDKHDALMEEFKRAHKKVSCTK